MAQFHRNQSAMLNEEQVTAVRNIVQGSCNPVPYILFGPPGTGKTRTLIAAIEQIVKSTDNNILVCAQSNAACDEITERLLAVLNEDQVYRMYSTMYNGTKVSERVRRVSNANEKAYPALKELYKYRVLVCTLCTAGCLTRARSSDWFDAAHFSYVMIDECASTQEIVSLIPIAGKQCHYSLDC